MEATVYLSGKFVPESEAKVSILDRGFNAGDGVYEVTRTFRHKPFRVEDHIGRLYRSMRYTRIDCDLSTEEMNRLTHEVIEKNIGLLSFDDDVVIWHVISSGIPFRTMSHTPEPEPKPTVAIWCMPVQFSGFARAYVEGGSLVTPSTRRAPSQCLDAKAKITNKMNHHVALAEARLVDPAASPLMLDIDGNITETQRANFFFVNKGKLFTPKEKNVLSGITRDSILQIAARIGLEVQEGDFTPYDVYNADEAFTTGTSVTITPIRSLDRIQIGDGALGPVTLSLIKAWIEMVGVDFVEQALSHLDDLDKQKLLGRWAEMKKSG